MGWKGEKVGNHWSQGGMGIIPSIYHCWEEGRFAVSQWAASGLSPLVQSEKIQVLLCSFVDVIRKFDTLKSVTFCSWTIDFRSHRPEL